jgi:hypothetical protein
MKNNIERKTWAEFRETGLLLIVNTILHALGWVIVFETEGNKIVNSYPARTKFRGFDNKSQDDAHTKIAKYLAENAPNFPEEIK